MILSRLPESVSYGVIDALQQDFDFLRFVQGDLSKNIFYDEARLLIYKIRDIISGTTIPNYAGTVTSLNDDVLIGIDTAKLYGDLKDAKRPPSLELIESLITSILNNLGPYITSAQLNKMLDLVNNFKASVVSYHAGTDLLNAYKDGFRKAFINDLINSKITPILQQCPSIKSLSYLLFGDRSNTNELNYGFFKSNSDGIYDHISLSVLRHIRMRVSSWSVNDFWSGGLSIGQNTVDLLIKEITGKIDEFISGSKFYEYFLEGQVSVVQSLNYLNKRYLVSGYESEEALVQAFHHAVTIITGTPGISNKWLGKIIGASGLYQAQRGKHFSIKTLRKMITFLETIIKDDTVASIPSIDPRYVFMSQLNLEQRQEIYEDAKNTIENYMFEHGIDRTRNWPHESTKAYHVLKLLKRNVGFDILGFTALDKNIFIKSKGKKNSFLRHHFRNDFFRKLSNYVQDLVLTSSKDHVKYESYSEAEMLVIIKGFDKMMQMKGSGIDGGITKNDVIKIFTIIYPGNEWVLNGPDGKGGKDKNQGWFFSEEGFDKMLTEFNKRKSLLQNEGLDQFLIKKYDTVYERFYLNFPHGTGINIADADGFYSLVVPHPTLGDFAMGLNFDSGFLYPEY